MKPIVIAGIATIVLAGCWWLWGINFDSSQVGLAFATDKTEMTDSAASVAIGDILLIRSSDNHVCALRFERMTADAGADYSVWFVPATAKQASFRGVEAAQGHVYEKYWRTRGLNGYDVMDIGGNYAIPCGPTRLAWSLSTWVYFPPGFRVAALSNRSVDEIDLDASDIVWRATKVPEFDRPR